jgi:hypothetical protein
LQKSLDAASALFVTKPKANLEGVPCARTNDFSKKMENALNCRVSTGGELTALEAEARAMRNYCSTNSISEYPFSHTSFIRAAEEIRNLNVGFVSSTASIDSITPHLFSIFKIS